MLEKIMQLYQARMLNWTNLFCTKKILAVAVRWWGLWSYQLNEMLKCNSPMDGRTPRRRVWNSYLDAGKEYRIKTKTWLFDVEKNPEGWKHCAQIQCVISMSNWTYDPARIRKILSFSKDLKNRWNLGYMGSINS